MKVLGIETATSVCGAALSVDGVTTVLAEIDERFVHAEKLMGLIDRVLDESGVRLAELGGVAVSIGPGSFTGLRIGLSAAKGLVVAAALPLIAVPTLDALARRLMGHADEGALIVPVLDARRGEVYCRSFRMTDGHPVPEGEVRDVAVAALAGELAGRAAVVTGEAAERMQGVGGVALAPREVRFCSAASIAVMGDELLRAGVTSDPRTLEPRYIKDFFIKAR